MYVRRAFYFLFRYRMHLKLEQCLRASSPHKREAERCVCTDFLSGSYGREANSVASDSTVKE